MRYLILVAILALGACAGQPLDETDPTVTAEPAAVRGTASGCVRADVGYFKPIVLETCDI